MRTLTHTVADTAVSSSLCGTSTGTSTRLLLRASEIAFTSTTVNFWSPVCDCGSTAAAVPAAPASPPAYVASGGPNGGPYIDCRVDDTGLPRGLTFGMERAPFLFEQTDRGVLVMAVLRLTPSSSTPGAVFSVRYGVRASGLAPTPWLLTPRVVVRWAPQPPLGTASC